MYKSFSRPQLDYGDVTYDETFNMLIQQKMETSHRNAALKKTGTIRSSSSEKLYQ